MAKAQPRKHLDIAPLLEHGRWSGYQKAVLAMCALAIVFDGLDIQVIGLAIPSLMHDWGLPRSAFASVAAVGLIGMSIGTVIGGYSGDRWGRRPTLICSVMIFGLLTFATAFVNDVPTLTVLRFLTGLGLGGAVPNGTTLAAEFTPLKNRSLGVILTIVCVPAGGLVGGVLASLILPTMGWKPLFIVSGLLPIGVAVLLMLMLPESPGHLVRFPAQHSKLTRLLNRLGHAVPPDVVLADMTVRTVGKSSIAMLFSDEYWRDTLIVWAAFFFSMVATYAVLSWLPSVLAGGGLSLAVASSGITAYSVGGMFGSIVGAWLIGKFGSKPVMLAMSVGTIISALFLRSITIDVLNTTLIIAAIGLMGIFMNAVQTAMYALVAYVYVSQMRATGSGAAIGIGRVGGVVSSFGVAFILQQGGPAAFYMLIAATMAIAFVALALLRKHVPVVAKSRSSAP